MQAPRIHSTNLCGGALPFSWAPATTASKLTWPAPASVCPPVSSKAWAWPGPSHPGAVKSWLSNRGLGQACPAPWDKPCRSARGPGQACQALWDKPGAAGQAVSLGPATAERSLSLQALNPGSKPLVTVTFQGKVTVTRRGWTQPAAAGGPNLSQSLYEAK